LRRKPPPCVPLLNDTLGGTLDKAAEHWPDREAVVVRDQGVRLSFSALRQVVDRLAIELIEWVLTQYATAKAGLILVNINPGYRAAELEYALNKVTCRALITADQFRTTHYIEIIRLLVPELSDCPPGALRAARLPHLTTVIHFADIEERGFCNFAAIRRLGDAAERARSDELVGLLQPDDPINIQFTSGTTGARKAATLTHHGLLNNGYFFGLMAGAAEADRRCAATPLYHTGAMVLGSICSIALGQTIIYLGEASDPLAALETIEAEKCNRFGGVPTMLLAVLNHPAFGRFDLSSLRAGRCGGSLVPSDVLRRARTEMNIRGMVVVYGMTELSGGSTQTAPTDTIERQLMTIGRVQPHMEVRIDDLDGRTVPVGTQGEVCFRGFMVASGMTKR
jgi:fatty-acyl-CoA synthase